MPCFSRSDIPVSNNAPTLSVFSNNALTVSVLSDKVPTMSVFLASHGSLCFVSLFS